MGKFEPVLDLRHYYDGPTAGVSEYCGKPFEFEAIGWKDGEPVEPSIALSQSRIFQLWPLGKAGVSPIEATGEFRVVAGGKKFGPSQNPDLEVRWQEVGASARAASCAGPKNRCALLRPLFEALYSFEVD